MGQRKTRARLEIATALLAGRDSVQWGYELSRAAGVGAGSMYPFLSELLEQGHLSDGWEDPAKVSGRPPRRYYELTASGERYLRDFLGSAPLRARSPRTNARLPGPVEA